MKQVLGLLLMVGGVALGVYVGFWVCFIGGIVQIIEQIKAPEIHAMSVAFGVAKIVFATFLGGISAFVAIVPGLALLKS